ncbi:MAG: phage tail protein [Synergistaceae bacterium]|jgi:hypothetical protein|nr:phage tail protein [Synergistaceae bacterium]
MIKFDVQTPDFERVERLLSHIPGAAEKAMSRAINKAINSAKAEAAREVKKRYTISVTEYRKGIKVIPATANHLEARLVATSALHAMSKFNIKRGKKLSSEIIRGNMRSWPHGFFAEMESGHKGLFARVGSWRPTNKGRYSHLKTKEASRGKSRGRVGEPIMREIINEKFSASTSEMVNDSGIIDKILCLADEKLQTELDRQIGLFLRGDVS